MSRLYLQVYAVADHVTVDYGEAVEIARGISGASLLEGVEPEPVEIQTMTIHTSMFHHLEFQTGPTDLQERMLAKWPNAMAPN